MAAWASFDSGDRCLRDARFLYIAFIFSPSSASLPLILAFESSTALSPHFSLASFSYKSPWEKSKPSNFSLSVIAISPFWYLIVLSIVSTSLLIWACLSSNIFLLASKAFSLLKLGSEIIFFISLREKPNSLKNNICWRQSISLSEYIL